MKAEVEKVITMSLTKMAESRGLRRGGTSLHKHLLISSVLTKARTAYMDSWCGTSANPENSAHSRPSGAPKLVSSSDPLTEEEESTLLDSRTLFQLNGTEMDLPSDILNCVERMGGISEDVEFSLRDGSNSLESESEEERRTNAELILAEFVEGLSSVDSSSSKSFTYLDLDQTSADSMVSNVLADVPTPDDAVSHIQLNYSATPAAKRRRDWNFDTEESDEDEDEDSGDVFTSTLLGTKRFRFALSENYTFRTTSDSKESTIPAGTSMLMSISTTNYNSSGNRTPLEPFFTFKGNNFNFRTKKSQFEECEDESTEDSSGILFEDEDYDEYDGDHTIKKVKNDRRVPSSNGSCSSSDEEHEQDTAMDMDLDKITNLVQYISFNKGNSSSGSTGLVRSISTPDLFSFATNRSESISGDNTSMSQTNTKDLYGSCFSSHTRYHQRVLTMKVL